MANIVLGVGTSHGPLLGTPPDMWHLRAADDRKNRALEYRGDKYNWNDLRDLRKKEQIDAQIIDNVKAQRHEQCQQNILISIIF